MFIDIFSKKECIEFWFRAYGIQWEDVNDLDLFEWDAHCTERYFKKNLLPLFFEKFYTNYRQVKLKS